MKKRHAPPSAGRKPAIDWLYHRQYCDSCRSARDFLERRDLTARTSSDARVERFDRAAVLKLLRDLKRVVATRGRAIRDFSLDDPDVDLDQVADLLIGPSGNLRAPTIRIGRTLITGFSESLYAEHVARSVAPEAPR